MSSYTFDSNIQNRACDSPEMAINYDEFKPTENQYRLMLWGGATSTPNNPTRIRIKRKRNNHQQSHLLNNSNKFL